MAIYLVDDRARAFPAAASQPPTVPPEQGMSPAVFAILLVAAALVVVGLVLVKAAGP